MKQNTMPFIRVSKNDRDTISKLTKLGFVVLPETSTNDVLFLNDQTKRLVFDGEPLKVNYTNVMCM